MARLGGSASGAPLSPLRLQGDEVAANFSALVVVLDHRQLLRHVEGEVVVGSGAPATPGGFPQNWGKVLTVSKTVLRDAILDPRREVFPDLKRGVKIAGIAKLGGLSCECAGKDRHQLGVCHDGCLGCGT